jgi:hypothetical protein
MIQRITFVRSWSIYSVVEVPHESYIRGEFGAEVGREGIFRQLGTRVYVKLVIIMGL